MAVAAAFVAVGVMAGCVESPMPGSTSGAEPTAAEPPATPEPEDPFGGVARPDGSEAPSRPSTSPTARESELITLAVGNDDHSDLDWQVSCSGVGDQNLSVIASASDGDHNFTVVLLGSGEQMSSFTFTAGRKGEGLQSRSGLTVTPGSKQGNGSLTILDGVVKSNGGGTAYGPDVDKSKAGSSGTTSYQFEVYCKL